MDLFFLVAATTGLVVADLVVHSTRKQEKKKKNKVLPIDGLLWWDSDGVVNSVHEQARNDIRQWPREVREERHRL